jgi:glycosyltransferase involved in cell wall biosynthesis
MIIAYLLQDTGSVYGAERATIDLASGLAARGHKVVILLIRETRLEQSSSKLEAAFREKGLEVVAVETAGRFSLSLIGRIRRLLKDKAVQVLHTVGYKADVHGLFARGRVPQVSTVHGWLFRDDSKEQFYGWLNLFALRRCARVIALSRHYEEYLLARGISRARLARIPSGLDLRGFPARPVRDGMFVAGMMGRFSEEKNHTMLLRAAARIRDERVTMNILIAGDGPLRPQVEGEMKRLDLGYIVTIRDYAEREDFLGRIDALVLCSRIENLPYSVLEAMASGLPVVATRVGGLPDLVDDDVTGYLVPTDDDAALAERLIALRKDQALRARLGIDARAKMERQFSLEACLAAHEALYAGLA